MGVNDLQKGAEMSDGDASMVDLERLKRILGSCSINFLFGAGVNGSSFPQFNGFIETKRVLRNHGLTGDNIEADLREAEDGVRDEILEVYCEEFRGFSQKMNYESASVKNLGSLLLRVARIVSKAENRHPESKRINIFTLNYDRIVETELERKGQFAYVLNVKESKSSIPFEIVGYNTARREYVPTFAIYKMHGSADTSGKISKDSIVFPGGDKLGNVLSDFYETLFAMKGELLRKNSVLFVVGYSWADDHVNGVISDAADNGLLVYQLQFGKTNTVPSKLLSKIEVIPPAKETSGQDTTLTLANILGEVAG